MSSKQPHGGRKARRTTTSLRALGRARGAVRNAVLIALAMVLVLAMATGGALANGHAKPNATGSSYQGSTPVASRGGPGGPPASSARFTLEFVDAEVADVFQALSTQSGVNIAVSGSVTGKTTLRLRNVTLEQALTIVTKLNGYDYAWVKAAYVVGTPEEVQAMRVADLRTSVVVLQHIEPSLAQEVLSKLTPDVTVSTQKGSRTILLLAPEASLAKAERALAQIDVPPRPSPPKTEMVSIRYLKASQVREMITTALPDVTVQEGPEENSLLITANEKQWEAVRSLISASDVAPSPAQATQAFYQVKYTSPQELQKTLSALMPDLTVTLAPRSYTPAVQKASTGAGETAGILSAPQYGGAGGGAGASKTAGVEQEAAPVTHIILSGGPWTVERGLKLAEKLDRAPRQVRINAMITEISREDSLQLGIDWSGSGEAPGLGDTGVPVTMGEYPPVEVDESGTATPGNADLPRGLEVGKIQRSYLQWTASIRALEQQGRARILSNPSVTTLDGRQTSLHTGETYYYEVAIAAATTGGIVKDIRTFNVGVSLDVNPRVNENDEVTLTIAPTVAALKGTTVAQLPIVTERAVVTTVRVKSGETAVLAGLVSDGELVTLKKVPFLGDLPLLGELFKSRKRSPSHQEILIFVTPTILN